MIDWQRVAEMQAEIGDDDFSEVIEMFLEETDEVVARLGQPAQAADLARDLHFLKGSALNLGFRDLAALCQEGERGIATGNLAAIDPAALAQCYAASRIAFQAGLARQAA